MFEIFKKLFKQHFNLKNCTLLKEKQLLLKIGSSFTYSFFIGVTTMAPKGHVFH